MKRTGIKRSTVKLARKVQLRKRSEKRISQEAERADVKRARLKLVGHRCEYRDVVPEVTCGIVSSSRPFLELDEIRGGAYRCTEWLDVNRCRLTCQKHHDVVTRNKREMLRRLDGEPYGVLNLGL